MKINEIKLPAFAFVEGWGDDGLQGRTVIVHCPTGTIMEAIPSEDILGLNDDVLSYKFDNVNKFCGIEHYTMLLHVSPTFDKVADKGTLIELMDMAATWFNEYNEWEDNNIINGEG